MRYLPVEVDVAGREALVVGANVEVLSKIDRLLAAGARVLVVAPGEVDPSIEERVRTAPEGRLQIARRAVTEQDAIGKAIVFIATPLDALAGPFHERARREGTLLCTLDRPELSTFVNPAMVRASGLTITFATGGTSPGAMRRIREDLEALFSDPRFGRFLGALADLRARLPRGERAARMAEAVRGFAVDATLRFPGWFERGEEP